MPHFLKTATSSRSKPSLSAPGVAFDIRVELTFADFVEFLTTIEDEISSVDCVRREAAENVMFKGSSFGRICRGVPSVIQNFESLRRDITTDR